MATPLSTFFNCLDDKYLPLINDVQVTHSKCTNLKGGGL